MTIPERSTDPFKFADDQDESGAADAPSVVTLQAAIAWIATRDAEFTFSFREPRLGNMDHLIAEAGLCADFSVSDSWTLLRDAVVNGTVHAWGSKFEYPADFDLGEPWPRAPREKLPSHALAGMSLVDVRGMAVRPEGIISIGQTWYCRILIQRDQLQSAFISRSNSSKPITRTKQHRAPVRSFIEQVLRKNWSSSVRPEDVSSKAMYAEVVDEAKRQNKPEPPYRSFSRALAKVWPKDT
jgi:hypothetical protein